MKKRLSHTEHRLQYNYAVDDIPSTNVSSYSCHNCNSSMNISIHRHKLDTMNSIQLWSCNECGFRWKEIWSSYGQRPWSAKY
jgi:C4-type Zn-finger protein